ncbi:MAG: TIGR03032 family protein, partial [Henriciella sp.]
MTDKKLAETSKATTGTEAPAKKAPAKKAAVKKAPAKAPAARKATTAKTAATKTAAAKPAPAAKAKTKPQIDVTRADASENKTPDTPATKKADEPAQKTSMSFSGGLQSFLATQNISIAFTSYQSGNIYLIGGGTDGKLSLHSAKYPKAMGIVGDGSRIYLATLSQIVRLENTLSGGQIANGKHDKLYVPRSFQTTGDVDLHEVGVRKNGRVVFVNTRYSCLAQFNPKHSFEVLWKPPFISKIVPEDRCHLNGLAMRDGEPKYVTAVCRSDTVDGWRDRRDNGGVIIDIDTNEIMAEGLSMPHSPRWHNGKLWVLNSGSGELGWINPETKSFEPVAFCPGFVR